MRILPDGTRENDFPLPDARPKSALAPATGSALVRAAKKRARAAHLVNDADRAYGEMLAARYGWIGEELPDSLVEVIDYGNAPSFRITLKWLDAQMATIRLFPLPNGPGQGRAQNGESSP